MIDELFKKISHYNLIDWGIVLLGVIGIPGVVGRLSSPFIQDFAANELEKMPIDDPLLDVVARLAMDSGVSLVELHEQLEKVCQAREIDLNISKRKWCLVSLEDTLSELDSDPIYGLIKLSEFWSAWGWPVDAPSSMRNNDNQISSQEYHSQANYEYVIRNHREWLVTEHASLR